MYTEKELVTKIINGNTNAYRLLIKDYERLVVHMVSKVVKDENDLKDVCQEVFIKIYKNLKRFTFQSKLSTWIGQIAYRAAIDYSRKYQHRQVMTSDFSDSVEKIADNEEERTPAHDLSQKEMKAFIHQAIEKLPDKYKIVLSLFHLEEYSYQEIAVITGMAEGTIKSHLFRARKLLKDRLAILVN